MDWSTIISILLRVPNLFGKSSANDPDEREWFGPGLDDETRDLYNAYLSQVYQASRQSEPLPTLDVVSSTENKGLIPSDDGEKPEDTERQSLREAMENIDALLLTGPPGSGKTIATRQLTHHLSLLAAEGPLAFGSGQGPLQRLWRGLVGGDPLVNQPPFPVHVHPGDGDIYYRIALELHSKGVGESTPSEAWVFEALKQGLLFVIVDDAHRFEKDQLSDLMKYADQSTVLFSGRETKSLRTLGLRHVRMAPLTRNQAEAILATCVEGDGSLTLHRISEADGHRALASRPQTLRLLAQAYGEDLRPPPDKHTLFNQALIKRSKDEEQSSTAIDEPWCKKRILGAVALSAVGTSDPYAISLSEAREQIQLTLSALKEDKGLSDLSVKEDIIDVLDERGYFHIEADTLRFEHDQWEEFFAAEELVRSKTSLSKVQTEETKREVSLFAAAVPKKIEDRIKDRSFWQDFWSEISHIDPFWALKCRREIRRRNRWEGDYTTVADVESLFGDLPQPTDDEITESFSTYLEEYRTLCREHFPRLRSALPGHGEESVTVVVERENDKFGNMMCIVRSESGDESVQIVDDLNYQTVDESIRLSQIHSAKPARRSLPTSEALSYIQRCIESAWREENLWEPNILLRERAYYEGVALYREAFGRSEQVPPEFDAHDLLKQVRANLSSWDSGSLQHWDSVRNQQVELDDWQETLNEASTQDIKLRPLSPPISPPWQHEPPLDGGPLRREELEELTDWSRQFYQYLFETMHTVIEESFPTTKEHFSRYSNLYPVLVLLIPELPDGNEHTRPESRHRDCILGMMRAVQLKNQEAPTVEVEVTSEDRAKEIVEDRGTGHGLRKPWRPSFLYNKPLLRNHLYRITERDLEGLLGIWP